ncbi:MAG: adenylate/guanylate cyclase domain-containing protein [Chlamydiota bacterium]
MKTLKAKLFFSMGAILLFVGGLNIILSEVWIKRGLARKGSTITQYVKEGEKKVEQFSSFLLTLRMVEEATGLERVVYKSSSLDQEGEASLWKKAEEIISYDPQIAFVRIQKGQGESISIAPQDASLAPFSFAKSSGDTLWVKILEKEDLFIAIPAGTNNYLLFTEEEARKAILQSPGSSIQDKFALALKQQVPTDFQKIEMPKDSFGMQDTVPELFEALLSQENEWLYKMDLIQAMISWTEGAFITPVGAIKIVGQNGGCLFKDQVFSTVAPIKESLETSAKDSLFLLLRDGPTQKDVDVVREFFLETDVKVTLGFSVYRVLKEIAFLSGKTILVKGEGVDLGIKPDGTTFDAKEILLSGKKYSSFDIDFALFSVAVLTPEEEALAIDTFLAQLGHEMIVSVSLSLLAASLISFMIALALLRNISTKITEPIAILSQASEHLGSGDYEKIILPKIGHRQDEVAKLSHSFAGMVSALQDRDKIRGVLHKVVSKEISEEILKGNLDFTGEERVLTLLFSDIRNFTKMSEGLSPKILIPMLNLYLTRMCRIIDATHGVVDKFVGDEIMTLYGAPLPMEFHAALAVEAALSMMLDLREWNKERKEQNLPIFEIGIGIHTGLVYTGNMGAENRLNYTAIGSNVNLASRVCSVAKPMQILITEETLKSSGVQDKFRIQALEPTALKGIEHLVKVYEVLGRI